MLFIEVDSENKSVVLAQGFFSDEQTTSFFVGVEALLHHLWGTPGGTQAAPDHKRVVVHLTTPHVATPSSLFWSLSS